MGRTDQMLKGTAEAFLTPSQNSAKVSLCLWDSQVERTRGIRFR